MHAFTGKLQGMALSVDRHHTYMPQQLLMSLEALNLFTMNMNRGVFFDLKVAKPWS